MLQKLAGIATAVTMAMAIAILATLIESPSARMQVPPPTSPDRQSGRGTAPAIDKETHTRAVETADGGDLC